MEVRPIPKWYYFFYFLRKRFLSIFLRLRGRADYEANGKIYDMKNLI